MSILPPAIARPSEHLCTHRVIVRLANVRVAIGPDGCLCGAERQERYLAFPLLRYRLDYCANPTCERVMKVETVGVYAKV